MAQWLEGTVVESVHWTPILFSFKVEVETPPFVAGQFVSLALEVNGERIARPYSIISTPGVEPKEFFFYAATGGALSPELQKLSTGDKIWVKQPANGFFVLNEIPVARDLWMLATGTGIAPLLSILGGQEVWSRYSNIILVQSVRAPTDLLYQERIQAIKKAHGNQFIHQAHVTRENLPGTINARIPLAIQSGELEQQVGLSFSTESSQVMLCGNPGMIAESVAVLKTRGLTKNRRRTPGQLTTENYW